MHKRLVLGVAVVVLVIATAAGMTLLSNGENGLGFSTFFEDRKEAVQVMHDSSGGSVLSSVTQPVLSDFNTNFDWNGSHFVLNWTADGVYKELNWRIFALTNISGNEVRRYIPEDTSACASFGWNKTALASGSLKQAFWIKDWNAVPACQAAKNNLEYVGMEFGWVNVTPIIDNDRRRIELAELVYTYSDIADAGFGLSREGNIIKINDVKALQEILIDPVISTVSLATTLEWTQQDSIFFLDGTWWFFWMNTTTAGREVGYAFSNDNGETWSVDNFASSSSNAENGGMLDVDYKVINDIPVVIMTTGSGTGGSNTRVQSYNLSSDGLNQTNDAWLNLISSGAANALGMTLTRNNRWLVFNADGTADDFKYSNFSDEGTSFIFEFNDTFTINDFATVAISSEQVRTIPLNDEDFITFYSDNSDSSGNDIAVYNYTYLTDASDTANFLVQNGILHSYSWDAQDITNSSGTTIYVAYANQSSGINLMRGDGAANNGGNFEIIATTPVSILSGECGVSMTVDNVTNALWVFYCSNQSVTSTNISYQNYTDSAGWSGEINLTVASTHKTRVDSSRELGNLSGNRSIMVVWSEGTSPVSVVVQNLTLEVAITVPQICGTLGDADTTYTLTQNVSSAATCFTISANNVILDGAGFNISFSSVSAGNGISVEGATGVEIKDFDTIMLGSSSVTSSEGILLDTDSDNFEIRNVTINIVGSSTDNSEQMGIKTTGTDNGLIANVTVTTTGRDGDGISLQSGTTEVNITGVTVRNTGREGWGVFLDSADNNRVSYSNLTSTQTSNSRAIYIDGNSDDNLVTFSDLSSTSAGRHGVYVGGDGVALRNNFTNNNISGGLSAFFFFRASDDGLVVNNTIQGLGTGAGVHFSSASGVRQADDNLIYDNVINVTGNNWFGSDGTQVPLHSNNFSLDAITVGTNIVGGANLGGNFYANSTSTGYSDTCTDANSDDICDAALEHLGNHTDFFPLAASSLNISFTTPTDADNTVTTNGRNHTYINLSVTNRTTIDTVGVDWNGTNITVWGDDLVGLWHLNNDTEDSSGNGNNGSISGDTDCRTSVDGKFNTACSFDGANDHITIGTSINMASWTTMTAGAWVNYDSSGADEHTIISNWVAGANIASILLRLEPSDDTVEGFIIVEADTAVGGTFADLTVSANEWHHVFLTYNGSHLLAYLDGVQSSTTFAGNAALDATSSQELRFGESAHSGSDDFTGSLDEVRIWNRALSADEISILWRSEIGKYYANITEEVFSNFSYRAWVNDTEGNIESTAVRNISFRQSPVVNFITPTDEDNTVTTNGTNHTYINLSVLNDSKIDTVGIEWNGTNITVWGDDLIAVWHLNNNTLDSSGNGYDGTNSGANCSTDVQGRFDLGCDFNGGNDQINITGLNLSGGSNFTFSAWVKTNINLPFGQMEIISQEGPSNARAFDMFLERPGNGYKFTLWNQTNIAFTLSSATHLDAFMQQWHHITVTINKTAMAMYIDGILEADTTAGNYSTSVFHNANTMVIGGTDKGAGANINGRIDEVRIWNRSLDQKEIAILWRSDVGKYYANITENSFTNFSYYGWANNSEGYTGITPTANISFQQEEVVVLILNGSLNDVSLNHPSDQSVNQNSTVSLNASVTCVDDPCGEVNATIYYNLTGLGIGTQVNVTVGDQPFYNSTGLVNQTCSSSMEADDVCSFNITVNATDFRFLNTSFTINFTSNNSEVTQNGTNPFSINVTSDVNRTLKINFTTPTDSDNANVSRNHTYINMTIDNSTRINTVGIEWNGTNITIWGDDLAAVWHLNNNTLDSSGNGRHGTNFEANCSTNIEGRFGTTGCEFDGNKSRINFTDAGFSENLSIFSVGGWVKLAIQPPLGQVHLISKDAAAVGGSTFRLFAERPEDAFKFEVWNETANRTEVVWGVPSPLGDFWTQWHHLMGVYNGTHTQIYVDGNSSTNESILNIKRGPFGNTRNSTTSLLIGGRDDPVTAYFNGSIDEVRFWQRALTAEEIEILWRSDIGKYYANITENDATNHSYYGWVNTTTEVLFNRTETRNITFNIVTVAADSCSCPPSGDFEVINGDACELTSVCNIGTNNFRVLDGGMSILPNGHLIAGGGCFVKEEESLYVDNAGKLFCGTG